jgi:hypothetical protein
MPEVPECRQSRVFDRGFTNIINRQRRGARRQPVTGSVDFQSRAGTSARAMYL